MNGTPGKIVTRCRSSSSSARPRLRMKGFGSSMIASVLPLRTSVVRQMPRPYVWNSGMAQNSTSDGVIPMLRT